MAICLLKTDCLAGSPISSPTSLRGRSIKVRVSDERRPLDLDDYFFALQHPKVLCLRFACRSDERGLRREGSASR